MPITISIINNKGGVGKTTTTQNLGNAFQVATQQPFKVLLIDMDSQANLSKSFGVMLPDSHAGSAEVVLQKANINTAIINVTDSLDLLPSSQKLSEVDDKLKGHSLYPFNLKLALNGLDTAYDFILIDCPPALSHLTKVSLMASDYFLVPFQAEYFAYEGLKELLKYMKSIIQLNRNIKPIGVFATRYNPRIRKKISFSLMLELGDLLHENALKSYIRENISLVEAQFHHKTIFDFAPKSNGAEDYLNLAKEILQKIGFQTTATPQIAE